MARPSACLLQDSFRGTSNYFDRPEQDGWIEVSLDGDVVSDCFPSFVQGNSPIDADDAVFFFATCRFHCREQGRIAGSEVDDRHIRWERLDDRPGVRQNEFDVIVDAEAAGPTVEKLHDIRTRFDLCFQVKGDRSGKFSEQLMPSLRVVQIEKLRMAIVAARTAFDGIRGERKRRASEADQR